jgi:hypothetical protein
MAKENLIALPGIIIIIIIIIKYANNGIQRNMNMFRFRHI